MATSIVRNAVTDKEGGSPSILAQRLLPRDPGRAPPRSDRPGPDQIQDPGVFLPLTVKLQEGTEAAPIEVQATPHIVFHAQIYDSGGKKTRRHEFFLHGQIDEQFWFGQGRPNARGRSRWRCRTDCRTSGSSS